MPRYEIQAGGSTWTISRLADGKTLLLQGDDALQFGRKLESTTAGYSDDDVCDEYAELLR